MSFLVDTNILSELARPRPDRRVVDWAGGLSTVMLSVVTVEEVFFGLSAKPSPRIERWFEDSSTAIAASSRSPHRSPGTLGSCAASSRGAGVREHRATC